MRDARAENRPFRQSGCRNPGASARYNSLCNRGNGVPTVESRMREANQRKRRIVYDRPARNRQPFSQVIRNRKLPLDAFRNTISSHRSEREEYLEPYEATGPLQRRQIEIIAFVHLLRHVARIYAEDLV